MPGALVGMTLMRDFYQEIIDIIGSGGEDCCVFPAGDPRFEAADFLTFLTTGVGNLDGLTATYSEDRRNFDRPVVYVRNRTLIPIRWQLNETDEWATTPDIAAFSRDDTGSNPFSVGGLISFRETTGARSVLSKFGSGGTREWQVEISGNEETQLRLTDESASITIIVNSPILSVNTPHFAGWAYDANASAKSAAGDDVSLYIAGLPLATDVTNNASYEGMEALGAAVYLGAREFSSVTNEYGNWMSTMFFTHRLVTAAEWVNLNDIYVSMQREGPSWVLGSRY